MAVLSVKEGVTVNPPATALSSVTVKVIVSPSMAAASAIVTVGKAPCRARERSRIVPVAATVASTATVVPETDRATMNVSSSSTSESSMVATMRVRVSPAVPAKLMAVVSAV